MSKLNIRKVGAIAGLVAVVAVLVAGLTLTSVGQALVFAVTDTQTVLDAREVKTEYIQGFSLK